VFDPSSWRLPPIAPLPFARRYAAAVALPDGRILVIGGQGVSDGAPTASVMSYSPSSDAWR
jgi:N-acetylneuraminic acid mutarotase